MDSEGKKKEKKIGSAGSGEEKIDTYKIYTYCIATLRLPVRKITQVADLLQASVHFSLIFISCLLQCEIYVPVAGSHYVNERRFAMKKRKDQARKRGRRRDFFITRRDSSLSRVCSAMKRTQKQDRCRSAVHLAE